MLSNPFKDHKNCLSLCYECMILGYLLHCKLLSVWERGGLVKRVKRIKIVPQSFAWIQTVTYLKRWHWVKKNTVCRWVWRLESCARDSSEPHSRLSVMFLVITSCCSCLHIQKLEWRRNSLGCSLRTTSRDYLLFSGAHRPGSPSQEQFLGKAVSWEGSALCIVIRSLRLPLTPDSGILTHGGTGTGRTEFRRSRELSWIFTSLSYFKA